MENRRKKREAGLIQWKKKRRRRTVVREREIKSVEVVGINKDGYKVNEKGKERDREKHEVRKKMIDTE